MAWLSAETDKSRAAASQLPYRRGRLPLAWGSLLVGGVGLALVAGGCADGPAEASTLSAPRFLASATTPSSVVLGEPVTVNVLAWEVTDVAWQGCTATWQGTVDGLVCPVGAVDLGAGAAGAVDLASGGLQLTFTPEEPWYLLARDVSPRPDGGPPSPPMVVKVAAGGPEAQLVVTGIVDVDDAPLTVLETAATLDMHATVTVEVSSGGVTTFYASAGAFEPWRAAGIAGEVTVIAVVRETDGAVGWATANLSVVAP